MWRTRLALTGVELTIFGLLVAKAKTVHFHFSFALAVFNVSRVT